MSALTDLQNAVAQAQSDFSVLQNDVNAFIQANSGGATDAQLQAVTSAVQTLDASIKALDTVVNPPAPAPPASGS